MLGISGSNARSWDLHGCSSFHVWTQASWTEQTLSAANQLGKLDTSFASLLGWSQAKAALEPPNSPRGAEFRTYTVEDVEARTPPQLTHTHSQPM